MKKNLLLILTFSIFISAFSQIECTHDALKSHYQNQDSTFYKRYHQFMIQTVKAAKSFSQGEIYEQFSKRSTVPNFTHYIIPVVVHVVHDGSAIGTGCNISDAQIFNQIDSLNHAFKPYNIQFCLAKRKPDSSSFNGITRIQNSLNSYKMNLENDALMAINAFPTNQYLNIWVVKSILNDDGTPSNFVGSAVSPIALKMGVAVRFDFFGNYTTCGSCNLNSASRGKSLVHEMGHLFGLEHTFNGDCGGDSATNCNTQGDYICDTPPMLRINSQCSTTNTCTEYPIDRNDPLHNFMNYKTETCIKEFTPEQVKLMHYQIETYFTNVIDIDNLNFVLKQGCGQITALFKPNLYNLCENGNITLRALKKYPNCKYQWIITNSNNGSNFSTAQLSDSFYTHLFTTGVYDVSLIIYSGNYSIVRTIKQLITVQNCGNAIVSPRGNWYFGEYAGLSFKNNATVPNKNSWKGNLQFDPNSGQNLNSLEGCVVQNNKAGQLLFYGGGKRVGQEDDFHLFDKQHQKMPNGIVFGTTTSSQGGVVVPMPGSGSKFYLFTTNIDNLNSDVNRPLKHNYYGLRYSIIDTALNNGNGDVDSFNRNKPVYPPTGSQGSILDSAILTGEGIAAIPGCDSSSYFIIVANAGMKSTSPVTKGLKIQIYEVNSSGVQHKLEYIHTDSFWSYGYINASPEGNLISVCGLLFEFDKSNGQLNFLKNLQDQPFNELSNDLYCSKFSPDGNMFFLLHKKPLGDGLFYTTLRQYDLSKNNWQPHITDLKENANTLQNGPDGKLYISQFNDNYISVVNKPNVFSKIDYQQDKINLKIGLADMRSMVGLPNFIDAAPQKDITIKISHRIENCNSFYFYTNQCCKSSYVWDFGNGDTAHGKTALYTFGGKKGSHIVTLTIDGSIILKDTIQFGHSGLSIGGLNTTCDTINPSYFYANKPNTDVFKYQWSVTNGTIGSSFPNTGANAKWLQDNGVVTLVASDKYNCKDTATLNFMFGNLINNNVISTIGDCSSVAMQVNTPTGGNGSFKYLWRSSLNGTDFTYLTAETNENINLNFNNKTVYYQRVVMSNGCTNYSNIVPVTYFSSANTIKEFFLPDDYDKCYPRLSGSNIKKYYPSASIQWQKSTNGTQWVNWFTYSDTMSTTMIVTDSFNYYRRKSSMDTCVFYSNIYINNQIKTSMPQIYYCNDLQFPIKVPIKLNTGYYFDYMYYNQNYSEWVTHTSGSYKDTQLIIYQYPNTSKPITKNDSMKLYIQKLGCTDVFHAGYSNIIIPIKEDTVSLIQHPINVTAQSGDNAIFYVITNNAKINYFAWEYSQNGINNWKEIKNSNNDTLELKYLNACYSGAYYRCKIISNCNTIISNNASLIVQNTSNPNFDFWMKNTNLDAGFEPDDNSTSFVTSQDIWIRHNNDGIKQHQDINTLQDTNFLYITIRNRGRAIAKGAKLYTYWTWGATQESWPVNWTKNNNNLYTYTKDNKTTTNYMGGEINLEGIEIPEIDRFGYITIVIPWTDIPDLKWYDLSKTWYQNKMNICLLARIQTCDIAPYGMTFPEQKNVKYNIKQNNNIISRNTWTYPLPSPPLNTDGIGPKDEERRAINPNIINGGLIVIRNNDETQKTASLCITTPNNTYFDKAETYLEIGIALKAALAWSPSVVYNGLTPVVDNVYQITSPNACIENILLPAGFQDVVEPLFAYTDINNRFASGSRFDFHILQKDSLGDAIGECVFYLTDNLFDNPEPIYIETDSSFYICNNGSQSPTELQAQYTANNSFAYQIYNAEGDNITQISNDLYSLPEGNYTQIATDSSTNTQYITNIHVIENMEETIASVSTNVINCEALPYQLYTNNDSTIVYENNVPMDSTSHRYFVLDPTDYFYRMSYRNAGTCTIENTILNFSDVLMAPPTVPITYVFAKYNRTEDSCAFVRLSELSCNGTPLAYGKTIDIYDSDLQFKYTATIEQYGISTIGFKFCPPNWNTSPLHIRDWHSFIYKANLCEYCRIDFKADSLIVFLRQSTDIDTKTTESISLYPNPATQVLNLLINQNLTSNIDIFVFDNMGRKVLTQNHSPSQSNLIPLSLIGLSNGVYFVQIPQLGYNQKFVVLRE